MLSRITAAILLIIAGSSATLAADQTWPQWVRSLKGAVIEKHDGVISMIRFRDDVCASDRIVREKRIECGNRVNNIVLRLVEEEKTLIDIIASAESPDQKERSKASSMISEFNNMNSETARLTDSVRKDFPKQVAMAN